MRYIFLVSHFDRLYPGQYVCKTDFLLAIITGTCHLWSIEWKCDRILIWMWLCAFCLAYLACWVERQWDHYFLLKRSLCLWPIDPTMGLFEKVVYRLKHNAVLWMPIFFFFLPFSNGDDARSGADVTVEMASLFIYTLHLSETV